MHYQKISKYRKKQRWKFFIGRLQWTLPTNYSFIVFIGKHKKNISLAYIKRITVGKEIIKKS